MSKSKSWLFILRVVGIVLAGIVLWQTFRSVDVESVGALLFGVGPLLAIAFLPQLGWLTIEAIGWRHAFALIGQRPSLAGLVRVRITMEALLQTVPGGAILCESLAPYLLSKHAGIPTAEGVAGLAARKHLQLVSQALWVGFIFLIGYSELVHASHGLLGGPGLEWIVLGIALLLTGLAFVFGQTMRHGSVVSRAYSMLLLLPIQRVRRYLVGLQDKFSEADGRMVRFFESGPRKQWVPTLYFLLTWAAESAETWLLLQLLGIDVSLVSVASIEVVIAFIRHVVFVVPAGLGFQDAGYVAFFAALGIPDPVTSGAAFVVLKRAKELFWAVVGYTFLIVDRAKAPKESSVTPASSALRGAESA